MLSEKNVIGTQHQVYSYGLHPYTGPPFFFSITVSEHSPLLENVSFFTDALTHALLPSEHQYCRTSCLPGSSYFLLISIQTVLFSLNLKKKKSYIDLTHSTGFYPIYLCPLCRKHFKAYPTIQRQSISPFTFFD